MRVGLPIFCTSIGVVSLTGDDKTDGNRIGIVVGGVGGEVRGDLGDVT